MRDWGLLYQRQPPTLDAFLLALAVALHMPLLTLHMRAPQKGAKGSKLVNIELIEERIQQRKVKEAALPPKVPDAERIRQAVQKAQEVKQRLLQKPLPPPPAPKPVAPNLATGADQAKIQTAMKEKIEENRRVLESKKGFKENQDPLAADPSTRKEIKLGGGPGSAIQAGNRPALAGPQGPVLAGKSGFTVSKSAVPTSIGGGDEGGLKVGGGEAVVVPVGARARGDASVMSPVARVQNKGSLQEKAPTGAPAGIASAGPGLAVGGGGGGTIAVARASAGPVSAPAPAATASRGRTFEERTPAAPPVLGTSVKAGDSSLPQAAAVRRAAPKSQRPMFQITGPLEKRAVLSRKIPEYPEWARQKGVEASVTLQLTVSPDGRVKDNVLVLRTSGYPALDEVAAEALRQWRFVPLAADQFRDEVGAITFNFSIR